MPKHPCSIRIPLRTSPPHNVNATNSPPYHQGENGVNMNKNENFTLTLETAPPKCPSISTFVIETDDSPHGALAQRARRAFVR